MCSQASRYISLTLHPCEPRIARMITAALTSTMDLVLWLMLALSLDRSLGSWPGLCARNLHCIGGLQMLSHASKF